MHGFKHVLGVPLSTHNMFDCEIRKFYGPVFGVYSFSLLRKSLWWLVAGTVVEIH